MEAVAHVDVVPPKRYRRLPRLVAATLLAALALATGAHLYVTRTIRQPLPLPQVRHIDIWPRFFDLRPLDVVTTVRWQKVPITVSRHQFLIDQTIWQRMHFEDWDRLPADVRTPALDRLLVRYGHLVSARHAWPTMTAADWDGVPQPIRAMAFVSLIEHWVDYYDVGGSFDLDRRDVRQTVKAIAMSESWFDHRATGANPDGSVDIGLGGASDFARRTIRAWYADGRCDFTMEDADYLDPWLATRWLAFWFEVMLQEADGDIALAIRAWNWGIGRAAAGAGEEYLATIERRRERYFEGPSRSPTWRRLSIFRRFQVSAAPRPAAVELSATVEPAAPSGGVSLARLARAPRAVLHGDGRRSRIAALRVVGLYSNHLASADVSHRNGSSPLLVGVGAASGWPARSAGYPFVHK
jgi:hypothetical protein